jgi:hypothetical protein
VGHGSDAFETLRFVKYKMVGACPQKGIRLLLESRPGFKLDRCSSGGECRPRNARK